MIGWYGLVWSKIKLAWPLIIIVITSCCGIKCSKRSSSKISSGAHLNKCTNEASKVKPVQSDCASFLWNVFSQLWDLDRDKGTKKILSPVLHHPDLLQMHGKHFYIATSLSIAYIHTTSFHTQDPFYWTDNFVETNQIWVLWVLPNRGERDVLKKKVQEREQTWRQRPQRQIQTQIQIPHQISGCPPRSSQKRGRCQCPVRCHRAGSCGNT